MAKEPGKELLEELAFRFILNCPPEELESFERMLFLVEQAWWFYEDFYRESDKKLKALNLKEFAALSFKHVPGLKKYQAIMDDIYAKFQSYKFKIPTMGAIILNPKLDKALLVKGWKSGSSWGWPKGKINRDEKDSACAVREVYEEIGFDIASRLVESDFIEIQNGQQRMKLYIIARVPEDTPFMPQTRKEISQIGWHPINDLPATKKGEDQSKISSQKGASKALNQKYFMVNSTVGPLRKWIASHKKKFGSMPDISHYDSLPTAAPAGVPHAASTPVSLQELEEQLVQRSEAGQGGGGVLLNFRFDKEAIMRHLAVS